MLRKSWHWTKRLVLTLEQRINLFRWDFTSTRNLDSFEHEAHLLIAKNPVYARIALICILSFLHFNERAKIVLHCDNSTQNEMEKLVKNRRRRAQIKIIDDLDPEATWQISKLKLILSLSGTNNIFMDADLRWNGVLKPPKGLSFFVPEFQLSKKSPFRQLLENIPFPVSPKSLMKNTSFVGFSGLVLTEHAISDVLRLYDGFNQILEISNLGEMDIQLLTRLSEQIILIVLADGWATEIYYLKQTDSHKDGQFVESSYFGATGAVF